MCRIYIHIYIHTYLLYIHIYYVYLCVYIYVYTCYSIILFFQSKNVLNALKPLNNTCDNALYCAICHTHAGKNDVISISSGLPKRLATAAAAAGVVVKLPSKDFHGHVVLHHHVGQANRAIHNHQHSSGAIPGSDLAKAGPLIEPHHRFASLTKAAHHGDARIAARARTARAEMSMPKHKRPRTSPQGLTVGLRVCLRPSVRGWCC